MFKFKTGSQSDMPRGLSADEIDCVAGGVKPGPNGEGCTKPRRPTRGGQAVVSD